LIESPLLQSIRGAEGGEQTLILPDNDRLFADAMRRGNVVIGFGGSSTPGPSPPMKAGFSYTGEDPAAHANQLKGGALVLPELAEAAAGVGSVALRDEFSFGVVRRIPLVWSDGKRLYPSLVAEALRVVQGARGYVVHASPTTGAIQSVRIGAFDAPTGPTGELNMYYSSPRPSRYISAADIFDGGRMTALAPKIEGRIILIGTSATGLFDIRKTSLGFSLPGVEIHAQALEQIINGQFLRRHDWTRGIELLAMVLAVLSISAMTLYSGARVGLLFGGAVAILIGLGAWDAFYQYGVLFDPSFPLGGGITVWFVSTAFKHLIVDREKREIRGAFSHYVHPLVMKEIERNYHDLRLGGENCELTVMFTDVRDFSPGSANESNLRSW
jgi:adenylate cyclase